MKNHTVPLKSNHEIEENCKSTLQTELNILKQASEDGKKLFEPEILTNAWGGEQEWMKRELTEIREKMRKKERYCYLRNEE